MAYLSQEVLGKALAALNQREGNIAIPAELYRSAQNPSLPFLKAYEAWNNRIYPESGALRALSVRELEQWTAVLAEQQALVAKLEAMYPQRQPSTPSGGNIVMVPEIPISGKLPWWYWPVRVGAGVGAGYLAYRVLTSRGVRRVGET